jgi:cell division protein FtsL
MATYRGLTLGFLGAIIICAAAAAPSAGGTSVAGEPRRHVVEDVEIQARIDSQASQEDADRQAIDHLLQRSQVREIAASAGLDIQRASAAAAVLSGEQLKDVAARARAADAQFGGSERVTLTYTAIIIILLVIIILIVA